MKLKHYCLRVTEEQLTVIDRALDVLSRLHAGQFDVIVHDVFDYNPRPDEQDADEKAAFYARRDRLAQHLRVIETMLTRLEPNTHHSITNKELGDSARVAYDIVKVIRYQRWRETGQPAWSVYGYPPVQTSHEPLALLDVEREEMEMLWP